MSTMDRLPSLASGVRVMLGDEVYAVLQLAIMDGTIPPDERLNAGELARRFSVSPTPVREALARLESDGLVEKHPLKGYRTTDLLAEQELIDLFELRLLLEPGSSRARRRAPAGRGLGRASPRDRAGAFRDRPARRILRAVTARRPPARHGLPCRAQRDRAAGLRAHALPSAHLPPRLQPARTSPTPWTSTPPSRTPSSPETRRRQKPRCGGTSSSPASGCCGFSTETTKAAPGAGAAFTSGCQTLRN